MLTSRFSFDINTKTGILNKDKMVTTDENFIKKLNNIISIGQNLSYPIRSTLSLAMFELIPRPTSVMKFKTTGKHLLKQRFGIDSDFYSSFVKYDNSDDDSSIQAQTGVLQSALDVLQLGLVEDVISQNDKNVSMPLPISNIVGCTNNSDPFSNPVSIYISTREKPIVKVAAVQLYFELDTKFPFQIVNKTELKDKVLRVLKLAHEKKVDIVCLPELCVCEDWIPQIQSVSQNMLVIAGSYYDAKKHNVCKPVSASRTDIPLQMKLSPSTSERGITGQRMVPGDKLNIYETKFGKFSILICRDFINSRHYLRGKNKPDIIFVPSYNAEITRFYDDANNHINNSSVYIVISNTSLYGGTSIFGLIRDESQSDLVRRGFKSEGDCRNKLCELKKGEEGFVIADFNLIYKALQKPTPADPDEEMKPVSNIDKKVINF